MKKLLSHILAALTIICALETHAQDKSVPASSLPAMDEKIESLGVGALHLSVPTAWKSSVARSGASGQLTEEIRFVGANTNEFAIVLLLIHLTEERVRTNDVQSILLRAVRGEAPSATEEKFLIRELKGPELNGVYLNITDKNVSATEPKPGEYKYLAAGYVKLKSLIVSFRIVSNHSNSVEEATALEMIKQARLVPKK